MFYHQNPVQFQISTPHVSSESSDAAAEEEQRVDPIESDSDEYWTVNLY